MLSWCSLSALWIISSYRKKRNALLYARILFQKATVFLKFCFFSTAAAFSELTWCDVVRRKPKESKIVLKLSTVVLL